MEVLIGPHVYHYLHHPLFSSGEAMLYYALEHLVHTGALSFDHGHVHVGHGEHLVVDRLFFSRVADPGTLSAPEAFALQLFPEGKPFSLAAMRHHINHHVPEYHAFKTGPMQEHLTAEGMLASPLFTSDEGRKAYHEVSHLLHQMEHDEERLLADRKELDKRLAELGSNAILLHHGFLEQLWELPNLEPRLRTMLVMQKFLESGGFYHAKTMG